MRQEYDGMLAYCVTAACHSSRHMEGWVPGVARQIKPKQEAAGASSQGGRRAAEPVRCSTKGWPSSMLLIHNKYSCDLKCPVEKTWAMLPGCEGGFIWLIPSLMARDAMGLQVVALSTPKPKSCLSCHCRPGCELCWLRWQLLASEVFILPGCCQWLCMPGW
jgi:hypothetical protein